MKTSIFSSCFFLVLSSTLPAVAGATEAVGNLQQAIEERLNDPTMAESFWGVLIETLDTGEILYELNADRLFVPASNQKILTSAAAYRSLGPDFTYTTTVHRTGEIRDGELRGDLVVWGNGDPTVYNRFQKEPLETFKRWARELKAAGVSRITGNIVGDDNAWEDRHTGSGWPLDEITPWYFAEFGPLSFNENYVDLRIEPPATVDGEVKITPNVTSDYYPLIYEVKVVESGRNNIQLDRPLLTNTITVSGTVVAGSRAFEETPTITNPTLFYVTVLRETLEAEGISVEGEAVDIDDLPEWPHATRELPEVARRVSPPLREIIPAFMSRSQNMYGESLARVMGWNETGFGSFAAGRRVVQRELAEFGVESSRFRYSDGSGLTRYNHVSPRMIVAVNRGMYESDLQELWLDSQARPGSGTLARMDNEILRNADLRAKTGTLTSVRSLSGFITTKSGERLLFSILNNGSLRGASAVDAVVHDVLETVVEFDRTAEGVAGR